MARRRSLKVNRPIGNSTCRYEHLSFDPNTNHWENVSSGSATGAMVSNLAAWPLFPGAATKQAAVNTNAELQAITSCTIECWVKLAAITTPPGNHCFFGKWAQLGAAYITGSPAGKLHYNNPVGGGVGGSQTLAIDTWYHIVVSATNGAPGSAVLYLNGTAVDTGTWTANTTLTWPLMAGQFPGFWPLNGSLDTARLYPYAMSQDEVLRNYRGGLARHQ